MSFMKSWETKSGKKLQCNFLIFSDALTFDPLQSFYCYVSMPEKSKRLDRQALPICWRDGPIYVGALWASRARLPEAF